MHLHRSGSWILAAFGLAAACDGGDAEEGPISFTELRIEEIGATRAVVRFTTSPATECEAEFGPAAGALEGRARDPDMAPGETALEHEVALEDLIGATTYDVRARATTPGGTTTYSPTVTFGTLGAGPDPTADLRNVALLAAGATVVEVSSNWNGGAADSSFGIDHAFDGAMATEWSSNLDGDDAHAVLRLAAAETLTQVGYRSRMMIDGSSIVESFELTIDSTTYGPFATPNPAERYVFALVPAPTTTEVRFDAVTTTGGNTGAKEIQLFAE